jgi:hypothetical protein
MVRSRAFCILRAALILALSGLHAPIAAAATPTISFTRDVRPILSRYCFKCHGPDEGARQSGLRLDVREVAVAPAESGVAAIIPGKPQDSELIRRISSESEDERMPPVSTKMELTAEQKQVLKRWIESGAEYEQHWAFVAPKQAPLPAVKQPAWPRNAIDRFVLARLEAAGLRPSPQADKYTLIRRLSLDLVGLPPTTEEVDAFVNDSSPGAYERVVDRLLASPQYGERWARPWLDLARYADTNGYEKDRPRSIWPYRDWVIKALNSDLPFDQFTIEQIAGDMLPGATLDQRIATGFHRNTMLNEEGGIDPLEFRFHAMADRVAVTGTAWLGLTLGCAQCHTHKFDPVSHREYYQFMALLNNADEPDLDLPDPRLDKIHQENLREAERLLAKLPEHWPAAEGRSTEEIIEERFDQWLQAERKRTVEWRAIRPTAASSNRPLLTVEDDDSIFVSGDTTKQDTYQLEFPAQTGSITALRLEALPDPRLPAHGPGMTYYEGAKGDFFLNEFTLHADGEPMKFSRATGSYSKNRFGKGETVASSAIDGDHQTGWSVFDRPGERHTAVFVLEQPRASPRELRITMTFGRHYASSLGRFRISVTSDSRGGEARDLAEETESLLLAPDEKLTADERGKLREAFLLQAAEVAKQAQEVRRLRQPPSYATTLVMRERPPVNPRPTHRHHRGEFLQPKELVQPATLAVLPPIPDDEPRNRLGLARWLVSPRNPLTARVTVNRAWAAFFGRGIVVSLQDFGYQGEPPTHPDLLDWLAVGFVRNGWSLKRLHKQIVMSATYQQSSRVTPELLVKDPDNRLLARGPRVRLEAELIRDSVLRASGLLSTMIGGPSVYPPQPESVTTEGAYGALPWKASEGADRVRRSLYTFSKRTAPFAMYATFDAPSGEACVARRDVSNTPLQALTLLNDVTFQEAAQALGRKLTARGGSVESRATELFRRCLSRPPSPLELADLTSFYNAQRSRFAASELDAAAMAGEGAGDVNQRAAWTALARVLFNFDETIVKD